MQGRGGEPRAEDDRDALLGRLPPERAAEFWAAAMALVPEFDRLPRSGTTTYGFAAATACRAAIVPSESASLVTSPSSRAVSRALTQAGSSSGSRAEPKIARLMLSVPPLVKITSLGLAAQTFATRSRASSSSTWPTT